MVTEFQRNMGGWIVELVAPALIMVMTGSLTFFLMEVSYYGSYPGRVGWVLALFIFASVLTSRISIMEGFDKATLYGLVLGAATVFVLTTLSNVSLPLAIGFIGVIWWFNSKLTWDCTVLDSTRDSTDRGLLARFGVGSKSQQEPTEDSEEDDVHGTTSGADAKPVAWTSRLWGKKRVPNTPGVWVLILSLAAFPIFGIGQGFISDELRRQNSFFYFCTYLAAGLGLLATTALIGLQRYLQKRNATMPNGVALTWVGVGCAMIVAILVGAWILPRPHSEYSIAENPFRFEKMSSWGTSRNSVGSEGKETGQAGGRANRQSKQKNSGGQGSSSDPSPKRPQQNKSANSNSQNSQSDRRKSESSPGAKNDSRSPSSGKGETGNRGSEDNSSPQRSSADNGPRSKGTGKASSPDRSPKSKSNNPDSSQGSDSSAQNDSPKNGKSETGKSETGKSETGKSETGKSGNGSDSSKDGSGQDSAKSSSQSSDSREPSSSGSKNSQSNASPSQSSKSQSSKNQSSNSPSSKNQSSGSQSSGQSTNPKSNDSQNQKGGSRSSRQSSNNSSEGKKAEQQSGQRGNRSPSRPTSSQNPSSTPPKSSTQKNSSQSFQMPSFRGLIWMVQVLFWGVIVVVALVLAWKYRQRIWASLRKFIEDWKKFWSNLWSRKTADQQQASDSHERPVVKRQKSFSQFANPFQDDRFKTLSNAELVKYSFEAVEAWGRERGVVRDEHQTPHEYAMQFIEVEKRVARQTKRLADLYCEIAFARQTLDDKLVHQELNQLWILLGTPKTPKNLQPA